ncbi:hypothetical protein [Streptomyces microflavus]|uniref:hypothetical protein n=1 Tax=Streptomyces microflavus TaxID=1919 RepID=UPI002E331BE0|nr:hypothetical protein [Streptomyces microflavus]
MPTPPAQLPRARSLSAVNEDIRALWRRSGGVLAPEERQEYESLLAEWNSASQADASEAA